MFNKSERDRVVSFIEKMNYLSKDIAKYQQSSDELKKIGAYATATYLAPYISVPLGFPVFTAWSLMKPDGYTRRWLTSGLMPKKTIATATTLGRIETGKMFEKEKEE
jgi:hypothetical protein